MEKFRARLAVSFSAKVLVPVVAVMVLLMGITVWTVNQRMTRQFRKEAAHSLATADKVFRHSHVSHTEELRLRYRNLNREPRYKAAFQTGDEPTVKQYLSDLLEEHATDVIFYSVNLSGPLASDKRDPRISITEFEAA